MNTLQKRGGGPHAAFPERSSLLPNEARPNAVRILEQFCRWKTKLLQVVPKATTPHKVLSH
jgi:hypothetical protein